MRRVKLSRMFKSLIFSGSGREPGLTVFVSTVVDVFDN
jgi:hypothetical protein